MIRKIHRLRRLLQRAPTNGTTVSGISWPALTRSRLIGGIFGGVFSLLFVPVLGVAAIRPMPPASLCVDEHCPSDPKSSGTGKKWHPGHYMLTYAGESQSALLSRCDEIANEQNVRGIMVRKAWADLESAKDKYTFGDLEQILARCGAHGKRVWLLLLDRDFNTTSSNFIPSYLSGNVVATKNGFIARIWEQPVMDREIALVQALAARFDAEPYWEGMMPEESGPGFGSVDTPAGYSTSELATQLKRLYAAAGKAWQRSNFVAQINFLGQEVDKLVQSAHDNGVALGGPDTLPPSCGSTRSQGQLYYTGSLGGNDYRNLMASMHQIQGPEMGGKEGDCSMGELSAEGHSNLRNTHYFWLRKTTTPGITWGADILPGIRAGLPYASACPKNYSTCDTN